MTTLESPQDSVADRAEAANAAAGNSARRAMIDSQLRPSGVNAPFVLRRMGQVAREEHVPTTARRTAYMDRAVQLENGAWLGAPLVQGMMLQEADPRGDEVAIVVDAGSGYLAELLRPLVAELTVLSPEEALGSGKKGRGASLLLIDGAAEQLPAKLLARLDDDARIVTGMIENGVTRIAVGRKTKSGAALLPLHDIGVPRLTQFDAAKGWSF